MSAAAAAPTPAPSSAPMASLLVPILQLIPSPTNPRKSFDKDQLAELTESVKKHGVLQPILVRPRHKSGAVYEVVAGERRFRAAKAAGLAHVPALIRELGDAEVLEIQVVENLQRSDLHPLEEAEGYHALTRAAAGYDVARIAERVGRSVTYVRDRLKLLSLTKAAQDEFRAGHITPGHAVLLARLSPKDQERAMDVDEGGLWETEMLPLHFRDNASGEKLDTYERDHFKPKSVRELQSWIDEHVHVAAHEQEDLPHIFPAAAAAIGKANEVAEKVVQITHEFHVLPEAREGAGGERIYGPQSWKRADGGTATDGGRRYKSKACEHAVTGVIVVGPGRGEAFQVCIAKKECPTHWGDEIKASKQRANAAAKGGKTGEDRWEIERRKQEEQRKKDEALRERWKKAAPAMLKALAEAVKKASASATGQLAPFVLAQFESRTLATAEAYLSRGRSAEDLVRYAAFLHLCQAAGGWWAPREFPRVAKAFGVDVLKILDEAAPEPKPASAPSGSAEKKSAAKGAKRKK